MTAPSLLQICSALYAEDLSSLEEVRSATKLGGGKRRGLSRGPVRKAHALDKRMDMARKLSTVTNTSKEAKDETATSKVY